MGKPDLHAKVDIIAEEFGRSLNKLEIRTQWIVEDVARIISAL